MSKLARLLGNTHPLFEHNLTLLEKAAGNAGIDARLSGEIISEGHNIIHSLGLDVADTTAWEFYGSLLANADKGLFSDDSYVIVEKDGAQISCNAQDIAKNIKTNAPFNNGTTEHAKQQLKLELLKRYTEYERTHNDLVKNLLKEIDIVESKRKEN